MQEPRDRTQTDQEVDMSKMPRSQAIDYMKQTTDYVFDAETAPKITHIWEDRGIRKVCVSPQCNRHEAWVKVR